MAKRWEPWCVSGGRDCHQSWPGIDHCRRRLKRDGPARRSRGRAYLLAPFALNHGNYQAYYAWLACAPIAALSSAGLVRLARLGRTGLVTTCCVIATLIPWGSVVPESDVVKAVRTREFLGLLADSLPLVQSPLALPELRRSAYG